MLVLILLLAVGSSLVYLSKFNFMPVSVNLGIHTFSDVPLFYVIAISLMVGLGLSYLFYLIHVISTTFAFRSRDKEIRQGKEEILELTKRVHQLELENEKLKHEPVLEPTDPDAL